MNKIDTNKRFFGSDRNVIGSRALELVYGTRRVSIGVDLMTEEMAGRGSSDLPE